MENVPIILFNVLLLFHLIVSASDTEEALSNTVWQGQEPVMQI